MAKLESDHAVEIDWDKLPEDTSAYQREVFDRLYRLMLPNQVAFKHPDAPHLTDEHWDSVCWNAAYAALACMDRRGITIFDEE